MADYGPPLGLHLGATPASRGVQEKPDFTGLSRSYFNMAEREGLLDQFSPIRQFPRKKRGRRVADYTDDYIVDYWSDQRRRIAQLPAPVNAVRARQLGNLIQSLCRVAGRPLYRRSRERRTATQADGPCRQKRAAEARIDSTAPMAPKHHPTALSGDDRKAFERNCTSLAR